MIKEESDDSVEEGNQEDKRNTGKGGRYRAFISRASQKDSNRLKDGRPDFRRIAKEWHAEIAKEASEELKQCELVGQAATKAGQEISKLWLQEGSGSGHVYRLLGLCIHGTRNPSTRKVATMLCCSNWSLTT